MHVMCVYIYPKYTTMKGDLQQAQTSNTRWKENYREHIQKKTQVRWNENYRGFRHTKRHQIHDRRENDKEYIHKKTSNTMEREL